MIGPYSLDHSVRCSTVVEPSGWSTSTEWSVGVIARASPSTRYDVGSLGSRVSRYAVKRLPADTVCDQANSSVKPMPIPGRPIRLLP